MNTSQQAEQPQPELYHCTECDAKLDAHNLFVPALKKIAQMQGEEQKKKSVWVVPEDLPGWAVCDGCRFPEEDTFTLASAIATSKRDQLRRFGGQIPSEVADFVSCFRCEERGQKTEIPRRDAMAPGWSGCNILKGRRLRLANPNNHPLPYVTSEDLVKSGKDGFVACPKCMPALIPELREQARGLGLSEDVITERIRPQSLVAMFNSVRRKESRNSGNS